MKKQILLNIPFFLIALSVFGQNINPAPADKAVVYFTRTSSLGLAINFSYFDSTQLIGVFNGPKYIRYECEPGRHIFWARSENKDFVEANIEAGKIYFIEAVPLMGAIKAGVDLQPVYPDDAKMMKKILKLMEKRSSESFSAEELQSETVRLQDAITRGMAKYIEEKNKGSYIPQLMKDMNYVPSVATTL
jgi:hypothetical protein